MRLAPHPRLYIGPHELAVLRTSAKAKNTHTRRAIDLLVSQVRQFRDDRRLVVDETSHNWHLIRARKLQERVFSLLVEWRRTDDEQCRAAALDYLRELESWQCWSWIEWRGGQKMFDLSYGENSTTIAVAYDLLYDTLNDAERTLFIALAHKAFERLHSRDGEDGRPLDWWWNRFNSNWLTVCAGGAGMLALAMYEEVPEGRAFLSRIDRAVMEYMKMLDGYGGGWPEGVAYWNYGMCYAFRYLLSHEHATGKQHPAFLLPGTRATVRFPLDFSPHDKGTGFGDIVCSFTPMAFHCAVAERVGDRALVADLETRLSAKDFKGMGIGATPAEYLAAGISASRRPSRLSATGAPVHKMYPLLNWGILADRPLSPRLYMSVRGGSTEVPHAHLDLFSYHCVVDGVHFIQNLSNNVYLDTTFCKRQFESFEKGWYSKNTLLIGGLGISHPLSVGMTPVKSGGVRGFILDGAEAFKLDSFGQQNIWVGRLFLMVGERAFIIIDRFELGGANQLESRFYTHAEVQRLENSVVLRQDNKALSVSFAADKKGMLAFSQGTPVMPTTPVPSMVRWCSARIESSFTTATLFVPGDAPAPVTVKDEGKRIVVSTSIARRPVRICVSTRLEFVGK